MELDYRILIGIIVLVLIIVVWWNRSRLETLYKNSKYIGTPINLPDHPSYQEMVSHTWVFKKTGDKMNLNPREDGSVDMITWNEDPKNKVWWQSRAVIHHYPHMLGVQTYGDTSRDIIFKVKTVYDSHQNQKPKTYWMYNPIPPKNRKNGDQPLIHDEITGIHKEPSPDKCAIFPEAC